MKRTTVFRLFFLATACFGCLVGCRKEEKQLVAAEPAAKPAVVPAIATNAPPVRVDPVAERMADPVYREALATSYQAVKKAAIEAEKSRKSVAACEQRILAALVVTNETTCRQAFEADAEWIKASAVLREQEAAVEAARRVVQATVRDRMVCQTNTSAQAAIKSNFAKDLAARQAKIAEMNAAAKVAAEQVQAARLTKLAALTNQMDGARTP